MKAAFANFVTSVFLLSPTVTHAQTFDEMNQQYKAVSPLSYGKIQASQVVAPEANIHTPESERLEQLKAQEEAERQARDEKIFLDTDYKFFEALAVPLQEDDVDKLYKKNLEQKDVAQAQQVDATVKTEIKTAAPKPLTPAEAAALDARRQTLRKQIATNARTIRACIIAANKKGAAFSGSEMTLAWDVLQSGKVEHANIQSTDVANEEIKKCVVASMSAWDFAESMQSAAKKSRIQYTFRFTKETKTDVALKSNDKTPALNAQN